MGSDGPAQEGGYLNTNIPSFAVPPVPFAPSHDDPPHGIQFPPQPDPAQGQQPHHGTSPSHSTQLVNTSNLFHHDPVNHSALLVDTNHDSDTINHTPSTMQATSALVSQRNGISNDTEPEFATPEHRPSQSITDSYRHTISPQNGQSIHPPPPPGQPHGQSIGSSAPNLHLNPCVSLEPQKIRRSPYRATQACDNCRERKGKCDEARPCSLCSRHNWDCTYKAVPPTRYAILSTCTNVH
jgi:hypothetical protein